MNMPKILFDNSGGSRDVFVLLICLQILEHNPRFQDVNARDTNLLDYFGHFFQKLHEIKKKLDLKGTLWTH